MTRDTTFRSPHGESARTLRKIAEEAGTPSFRKGAVKSAFVGRRLAAGSWIHAAEKAFYRAWNAAEERGEIERVPQTFDYRLRPAS